MRNSRVHVDQSLNERAGNGLFALKNITKGETIADLEGTVVTEVPDNHRGYGVYWKQGYILDTLQNAGDSLGRFANSDHNDPLGRKANARLTLDRKNHRARLKATRNITAGEEILLRYGKEFFSPP